MSSMIVKSTLVAGLFAVATQAAPVTCGVGEYQVSHTKCEKCPAITKQLCEFGRIKDKETGCDTSDCAEPRPTEVPEPLCVEGTSEVRSRMTVCKGHPTKEEEMAVESCDCERGDWVCMSAGILPDDDYCCDGANDEYFENGKCINPKCANVKCAQVVCEDGFTAFKPDGKCCDECVKKCPPVTKQFCEHGRIKDTKTGCDTNDCACANVKCAQVFCEGDETFKPDGKCCDECVDPCPSTTEQFCEHGRIKDKETGCDTNDCAPLPPCPPVTMQFCEHGRIKDEKTGCDTSDCQPGFVPNKDADVRNLCKDKRCMSPLATQATCDTNQVVGVAKGRCCHECVDKPDAGAECDPAGEFTLLEHVINLCGRDEVADPYTETAYECEGYKGPGKWVMIAFRKRRDPMPTDAGAMPMPMPEANKCEPATCKDGEEDNSNPCERKTCAGGKFQTAMVECPRDMMGEGSCKGKWVAAKEGECCDTCDTGPDPVCKGGKVWDNCGSACGDRPCFQTAEEMRNSICIAMCEPRCACPAKASIWDPVKRSCVAADDECVVVEKRAPTTWLADLASANEKKAEVVAADGKTEDSSSAQIEGGVGCGLRCVESIPVPSQLVKYARIFFAAAGETISEEEVRAMLEKVDLEAILSGATGFEDAVNLLLQDASVHQLIEGNGMDLDGVIAHASSLGDSDGDGAMTSASSVAGLAAVAAAVISATLL